MLTYQHLKHQWFGTLLISMLVGYHYRDNDIDSSSWNCETYDKQLLCIQCRFHIKKYLWTWLHLKRYEGIWFKQSIGVSLFHHSDHSIQIGSWPVSTQVLRQLIMRTYNYMYIHIYRQVEPYTSYFDKINISSDQWMKPYIWYFKYINIYIYIYDNMEWYNLDYKLMNNERKNARWHVKLAWKIWTVLKPYKVVGTKE